jgi:hypothetical protein
LLNTTLIFWIYKVNETIFLLIRKKYFWKKLEVCHIHWKPYKSTKKRRTTLFVSSPKWMAYKSRIDQIESQKWSLQLSKGSKKFGCKVQNLLHGIICPKTFGILHQLDVSKKDMVRPQIGKDSDLTRNMRMLPKKKRF